MKHTGNIALGLSILLCGVVIYLFADGRNKKIGVVQFHELIYEYRGMKDATQNYTRKMDKWSNQIDTLETGLKKLIEEIKVDSINNDKKKLKRDYELFLLKRQSYFDYKNKLDQAASEEDKKMTLGVINQVNEHIKAFAVKHGYDIIISNTDQQNVGYVKEAIDVTKQVIEFANENYDGKN